MIVVGAGDAAQLVVREMLKAPAARLHADRPDRRRPAQEEHPPARHPRARHDRRPAAHPAGQPAGRGADRDPVRVGRDAPAGGRDRAGGERSREDAARALRADLAAISISPGRSGPSRWRTCSAASRSRSTCGSIAKYLSGETVLVTGAGGSIGAELCRQIARVEPARLVLVEHSEAALFDIERELVGERDFSAVATVLGDCGDRAKMSQVFERYRPSVVFHAAAYKHVALLEANPLEAVRNNTLATQSHGGRRGRIRRRALRARLDGQGGEPEEPPRPVEGALRVDRRGLRPPRGHHDALRRRPLRQRPQLLGQRDPDLPAPDREGRAGHGDASGDDALLHDHPGGGVARRAGRRDRRPRPGLRPRHGRAGEDPRPRAAT